jgi:uncharacterized membrane protein
MFNIKTFVIVFILLLIVDLIWVSLIAGPKYKQSIPRIQNTPLVVNMKYGILVYLIMSLLILLCIEKKFNYKELFIVGFSSYFIYDFTNAAIFTNWDTLFGVFDSLWGGVLFSVVGSIATLSK